MLTQQAKIDCILRPSEAARKLGCARSTLYRWVNAGALKQPIPVGGKASGWRESDLEAFLVEREAMGKPKGNPVRKGAQ
jgi:prophage regulatory protein